MRECPNCHFMENPIWRHKRPRLFTDYCHISELKEIDSELASMIENKKDLKISPLIYHLTKAGYVDRIHELDSMDGKSYREPEQEKALNKKFLRVGQTRLVSVSEEVTKK